MIRIVLAEDQRMMLGALGSLLDLEDDLEVVGMASNGEEAIRLVEELNPDVCIMDIEMPVMNGLECTRKIREAESEGRVKRHLPIIAVSANAREGQVRHAMECGVDDAISKPFRVADLMPIIERLVSV